MVSAHQRLSDKVLIQPLEVEAMVSIRYLSMDMAARGYLPTGRACYQLIHAGPLVLILGSLADGKKAHNNILIIIFVIVYTGFHEQIDLHSNRSYYIFR